MRLIVGLVSLALHACTSARPVDDGGGLVTPVASVPTALPSASATAVAAAAGLDLTVHLADFDFAKNPDLPRRIAENPHSYYRFINRRFSQVACRETTSRKLGTPTGPIHGDAHLEQYTVTDLGRGITDLDDARSGPSSQDLLRMAASLRLAATMVEGSSEGSGDQLVDRFFRTYVDVLAGREVAHPVPSVVPRLGSMASDRKGFLGFVDKTIQPTDGDPAEQKVILDLVVEFLPRWAEEVAKATKKKVNPHFTKVKKAGPIKLGIGSALDRKFLVRVEGMTDGPDDDLAIEVKAVRDLSSDGCSQNDRNYDPRRFAVSAPSPLFEKEKNLFFAPRVLSNDAYWVSFWSPNFNDLKIKKHVKTQAELGELAVEVGFLLGTEHRVSRKDAPPISSETLAGLAALARELEAASIKGHASFRAEVEGAPATVPATSASN